MAIRLREPGRESIARQVLALFRTEDVESLVGCFVVLTERKILIRRPQQ